MTESIRRVYEIDVKLAADAAASLRAMQTQLKTLEGAAGATQKGMRGLFGVFGAGGGLGGAVAGLGGVVAGVRAVVDVLQAVPVVALESVRGILEIQSSLERLRLGFASISGQTGTTAVQAANREIEYLRKTTAALGIDFQSSAHAFLRFSASARGTTLAGTKTRSVFEGMSVAARNLGLTVPQTENAFRALEQMMSKGVVQQEELRGQLSEALPGAVRIAAESLGLTTSQLNKLIATGTLASETFIPAFARQLKKEFGQELPAELNNATVAIRTFDSAWTNLKQTVTDSGIGQAAGGQLNILTDLFNGVSEAIKRAKDEHRGFLGQLLAGAGIIAKSAVTMGSMAVSEAGQDRERLERRKYYEEELKKTDLSRVRRMEFEYQLRKTIADQEKSQYEKQGRESRNLDPLKSGSNSRRAILAVEFEQEAVERNRLGRAIDDLGKKYKDEAQEKKNKIRDLNAAWKAGLIEERSEYERLLKALTATGGARRAGRSEQDKDLAFVQRIGESIKQQIEFQRELGYEDTEGRKVLRQRIQLQAILINSKDKLVQASARLRLAELDELQTATATASGRVSALKSYSTVFGELTKMTEANLKMAESDVAAADASSKTEEQVRARTRAEQELLLVKAQRTLQAEIDFGVESTYQDALIEQLRKYIASIEEVIKAKDKLSEAAYQDKLAKDIEYATKKEAEAIAQRKQDLKDALLSNFRDSKSLGRAVFDTIQQKLQERVMKIIIDPVLDPLVAAIDALLQAMSKTLSESFASFLGGGGGGFGGLGGFFAGLFGGSASSNSPVQFADAGGLMDGFFADGGRISPGHWGVVGEEGPEVAFGGATGLTIAPVKTGTTNERNFNLNMTFMVPPNTDRRTMNQMGSTVAAAVRRSERNA